MIIIGITGTLGSGKGTIVDYLIHNKGFVHFSVRDYLIEKLKEKGREINRDTLTEMGNELRAAHSPSYIVEELYKQAKVAGKNCVIESIRSIGEVDALRKLGSFYLFAVDAEPMIRYERISKRASVTDHVTFETFMANEIREMTSSDLNKQNLSRCISMADFVFLNNKDIADLNRQVEDVLKLFNQ